MAKWQLWQDGGCSGKMRQWPDGSGTKHGKNFKKDWENMGRDASAGKLIWEEMRRWQHVAKWQKNMGNQWENMGRLGRLLAGGIVGKRDFASGNRFFGEYFSEFSGVFF